MARSRILSTCPARGPFYTRSAARATPPPASWFSRARGGALAAVALLGACDCGGLPEALRVAGDTGYVRCAAAEPPPEKRWKIGTLRLSLKGRTLAIEGPQPLRVAAFAGPGMTPGVTPEAFQALSGSRPHLALMMGSAGDTQALAAHNLRLAAQLPFPTLILPGGRDRIDVLRKARDGLLDEEKDRIVDLTGVWSVELGGHRWVLVPGAVGGSYAREPEACGIGPADLEAIRDALGASPAGVATWLLAWQAPAAEGAGGVARVGQGLDVGDAALAGLARGVGARGGLYAWPEVQVMRPVAGDQGLPAEPGQAYEDLRLVVPAIAGWGAPREDGSRVGPAFSLLRFDTEGRMGLESD